MAGVMEDINSLPVEIRALADELVATLGGTGQFILITRQSVGQARLLTNVEPRTIVADVLRQILAQEAN